MLVHLIKALWRRKSKNLLISFEILLIFFVIFAITVGVIHNLRLYKTPLGFEYEDRWAIYALDNGNSKIPNDPQVEETFRRSLRSMAEIESLSMMQATPYRRMGFFRTFNAAENEVSAKAFGLSMDDHAQRTLGIQLAEGRWFAEIDENGDAVAVVINRKMANELFPGKSAIGKMISTKAPSDDRVKIDFYKVVGVVEEYRYFGDFMSPENVVVIRQSLTNVAPTVRFVIKVKAGTPRNFEIKLHQQLKALRVGMDFHISTLKEERDQMLRQKAIFFVPPIVIAVFLLIMVSFGLFGVLWQNVNSRIPELGLRRAVGASSAQIYAQIVTEQVLLSSLAMAVGMLFLIQLPFTGIFAKFMDWSSFFLSAGIAMAIIYAVSISCALYPAWMASRMSPTDALHYE